jgi:4-amino-4-deoxy-L-arabinose transferase-like glycosyltransferase
LNQPTREAAPGRLRSETVILAGCVVAFAALIFLSAGGVRGYDQYWYVADVESLLARKSTTNNVFPITVLAGEDFPTTFIHYVPNLYFVLPAAALLGSYHGWVATNFLASLFTASILYLLLRRLGHRRAGLIAFAAYLLQPLTIYQTSQPLIEATTAPIVAVGLVIFMWAEAALWRWCLLVLVFGLAYYCRYSFAVVLVLLPLAYLWRSRPLSRSGVLSACVLAALTLLLIAGHERLFEQGVPFSYDQILNVGVPGKTGRMHRFFAPPGEGIQLWDMVLKALYNLRMQFAPVDWRYLAFFLPFNALAAATCYLSVMGRSRVERELAAFGVVLILLHVLTMLIFVNMLRYLLVALPPLLAAGSIVFSRLPVLSSRRAWLSVVVVLSTLLTVTSIPMAFALRRLGSEARGLRAQMRGTFEAMVPASDAVMLDTVSQITSYTLRPRLVMVVQPGYTCEEYVKMRERTDARWLVARSDSRLLDEICFPHSAVAQLLPFRGDWKLFSLYDIAGVAEDRGEGEGSAVRGPALGSDGGLPDRAAARQR